MNDVILAFITMVNVCNTRKRHAVSIVKWLIAFTQERFIYKPLFIHVFIQLGENLCWLWLQNDGSLDGVRGFWTVRKSSTTNTIQSCWEAVCSQIIAHICLSLLNFVSLQTFGDSKYKWLENHMLCMLTPIFYFNTKFNMLSTLLDL